VCSKPWNGRVGQAGLLGDADAVLGAGAGEVQALKLDRVAVEADRAVGALADAVADGVGKVVAALGTVWVKIGTPQVATQPGSSEPSPAVAFMQSQLWWFMAAAAILAVIIGGARMAWEQRAQPGRELLKGLLTLVVVSGCGLAVISLAMAGTDEFSRSVIDASLQDGSFAKTSAGCSASPARRPAARQPGPTRLRCSSVAVAACELENPLRHRRPHRASCKAGRAKTLSQAGTGASCRE
jgi:hypothetical protein